MFEYSRRLWHIKMLDRSRRDHREVYRDRVGLIWRFVRLYAYSYKILVALLSHDRIP